MVVDRVIHLDAGRSIHLTEIGDPDGDVVIYHHGGLSCSLDIVHADQACSARSLRLVAINRPGIRLSSWVPDYRLGSAALDSAQVATLLGAPSFKLMGWSAGGVYSLFAAAGSEGRVEATVCLGAPSPWLSSGVFMPLISRINNTTTTPLRAATLALKATPGLFQRYQTSLIAGCDADRRTLREINPSISDFYRGALEQGGQAVVAEHRLLAAPWSEQLGSPGCPVVLFHGGDDKIVPPDNAYKLGELLPEAEVEVLEGKGHFLQFQSLENILDCLAML